MSGRFGLAIFMNISVAMPEFGYAEGIIPPLTVVRSRLIKECL